MANSLDMHNPWFAIFWRLCLSCFCVVLCVMLGLWGLCCVRTPVHAWTPALAGHLSFQSMIHDSWYISIPSVGTVSGYLFLQGHLLWHVTCSDKSPVVAGHLSFQRHVTWFMIEHHTEHHTAPYYTTSPDRFLKYARSQSLFFLVVTGILHSVISCKRTYVTVSFYLLAHSLLTSGGVFFSAVKLILFSVWLSVYLFVYCGF